MKALIIFSLFSASVMAMPKKFEVFFMNTLTAKRSALLKTLEKVDEKNKTLGLVSALECQPMGDYCFDPQIGLYKQKDIYDNADLEDAFQYKDDVGSASSLDRELVNCDKDNFFDLYCGKTTKKEAKAAKLEIWIDTSSTLRQVDSDILNATCEREKFLRVLDNTCAFGRQMKVYVFDEFKKELGDMRGACTNSGLNKIENLIRDIKESSANHLIIITDIFELNEKFTNFIKTSKVGTIRGDKGDFVASSLLKETSRLSKICK